MTPILTRLYSPEEFGPVVLFTAFISIFSNVSGLRFELAIVIAPNDNKAKELLRLSVFLNLIFAIVFTLIGVIAYKPLCNVFQLGEAPWLFLVAPVFAITGIVEALMHWNNRERKRKKMSANRIVSASSAAGYKLVHPVLSIIPGDGLIIGHIIGQLAALLHFTRETGNLIFKFNVPHH